MKNMRTEKIKEELAEVEEQLEPLEKRKALLYKELEDIRSKSFIDMYNIKHEDVEMSSGEDKPYFWNIFSFADWMKENKVSKRFCEWNTYIYFTDEIITGRMDPDPAATVRDLEK